MTQALLDRDATDLIAAIAAGETSAADAARLYLSRIEAFNPHLHAVITVNPQAVQMAEALDTLPPDQRGPLHGLPMLIKDNIDVAGLPTTAGSALMAGHVPDADAPLIARLRAAGAVMLGKANLTEWANFMTVEMPNGYSSRGGQTVNPWAITSEQAGADTGGSSSGGGAAVAARLCAAAIGTETSGSILSPAHQNGVIGHKPTVGLIPRTGIVPISPSQDTAGPMTRTARDAALIASVIAGPDDSDAATASIQPQDFALKPDALQGANIGVVRGPFWDGLSDAQREQLDAALNAMRAGGAELTDVELATEKELRAAGFEVLLYEFKPALNAYLANVKIGPGSLQAVIEASDADPETLQRYGMVILLSAQATRGDFSERAYAQARARDLDLAGERGLYPLFARHDALVFPSYSGYAVAAKVGLPSVNIPVGLADAKPVGLQLCGPAWSDARLLALAADLHARLGGFVPAPEREA